MIFGVLLLLVGCSAPDTVPRQPASRDLVAARVVSLTDADSYVFSIDGVTERVRLIGVDAPEASVSRRASRQPERSRRPVTAIVGAGRQAAEAVLSMMKPGDTVGVELDIQERDRYGRLLVYVYLADGRLLNEVLLAKGMAQLFPVPPNVRYIDRFRAAAREGVWENSSGAVKIPFFPECTNE
jgi:micrococcal nuclease